MNTLEKLKEYPGKISDFSSYTDEDGVEYIDVEEFLKNFYIRNLYLEMTDHSEVIRTNIDSKNIRLLEKQTVITILKREQKMTSDLKVSMLIGEYIKTLISSVSKPGVKAIDFFNSIQLNDVIKVKVGLITDAGAMINVLEHPSIRGIIHISEIVSSFVTDVHEYFAVGDIVEAKVVKKLTDDYRLNLSTKEFKDRDILDKEIAQEIAQEIAFNEQKEKSDVKLPPEYYEIEEYVKSLTGDLSNDAKLKLMDLIEEYGVFQFSLKMSVASQDMTTDVGLQFLNKLEKVLES